MSILDYTSKPRKKILPVYYLAMTIVYVSCADTEKSDAYGNFEATTITISAKGNGELIQFAVEEGQVYESGKLVGIIDTSEVYLEKLETMARIDALDDKLQEAAPEISVLMERKRNLVRERERTKALVAKKAATQKQLDDYNGDIEVLDQEITSKRRTTSVANRSILSESKPLRAKVNLLKKRIRDLYVINPISGTIITQLTEPSEFVTQGTPLYEIANLDKLTLRAYTSANLLQKTKLNDKVTVLVDDGNGGFRELEGTVTWISSKAEFTPKTIETREERVNLVYALDVEVENDGMLKIGMPGEVVFNNKP
ncbi:MAG: HlyD family efflux transporter periplasmic adaptor subunit [Bacteroidota bacterium]